MLATSALMVVCGAKFIWLTEAKLSEIWRYLIFAFCISPSLILYLDAHGKESAKQENLQHIYYDLCKNDDLPVLYATKHQMSGIDILLSISYKNNATYSIGPSMSHGGKDLLFIVNDYMDSLPEFKSSQLIFNNRFTVEGLKKLCGFIEEDYVAYSEGAQSALLNQ